MFGNSPKKTEPRPAVTITPRSRVPSIISTDMTVKGEIRTSGELHLDGQVEGEVTADRLVIGETATVKGNVSADSVRVCGILEGNIHGREVVLAPTARMTGDINHEVLSLEPGARFSGAVRHLEQSVVQLRGPEPAQLTGKGVG